MNQKDNYLLYTLCQCESAEGKIDNFQHFHKIRMKKLAAILVTILIDFISFGIISPIIGPLLKSSFLVLDASYSDTSRNYVIGILTATFSIFQLFSGPILGSLSDRIGRKKVLNITVGLTFISYLVFAFGILYGNLSLLLLSRAVGGIAAGNLAVIFSSVSDISTPENKTAHFGMIGACFGIGFVLGPMIGSVLSNNEIVEWFNYTTPFFFTSILTLLNWFLIKWFYTETNTNINPNAEVKWNQGLLNFKSAWKNENLKYYFFMVFLFVVGFTVFTQYFQVKLIDSFHYDTPKIGYYYSFIGICIIIIQGVIVRNLYGMMQEKQVVLMALMLAAIGFTLLSTAETTLWIYLFSIIVAMGQGIFSPFISGLISTEASKENQGETFGIQSAVQAGAQICGPLLGAQLVNININFSLWAGAILSSISAMVFYKKKWN